MLEGKVDIGDVIRIPQEFLSKNAKNSKNSGRKNCRLRLLWFRKMRIFSTTTISQFFMGNILLFKLNTYRIVLSSNVRYWLGNKLFVNMSHYHSLRLGTQKGQRNFESDAFLWFAFVVNMSKIATFSGRFWIFL